MAGTGRSDAPSMDSYCHLYPQHHNEHILASEQRFNDLINSVDKFGSSSLVHKVEVSDGLARSLYFGLLMVSL